MKNVYKTGCFAILMFIASSLKAQVAPPLNQQAAEKPQLFKSLPAKMQFHLNSIQALFSTKTLEKFDIKLDNSLALEGTVIEVVQRSKQLVSMNLRLTSFPDALFNLSRISENGIVKYTGRILSKDHGDIYLLTYENGNYFFIKQQLKFTMVE